MNRLVLTSDDSGAGHVKQSGIGDQVLCLHALDSLVHGPVPPARDAATFFCDRDAIHDADPHLRGRQWEWHRADEALSAWRGIVAACEAHDRVEFWIDPDPNDQLHLIRSLVWLTESPRIVAKLCLVHLDDRLGERSADDVRTMQPAFSKVGTAEFELANVAWDAYRQPTPEAWFTLLSIEHPVLPFLHRTVLRLLDELPAVETALGATERRLLEQIGDGQGRVGRLLTWSAQQDPARVFGYWDVGLLLCELAACGSPPFTGLDGTAFDDPMHQDPDRHRRFSHSELVLTDLGRALVERRDDLARHNAIHRWWGGTLLTNASLWRWEAERRRLVRPDGSFATSR